MNNNISFVTYTHSNCKDLWKVYLSRLDRFSSSCNFSSYLLSNQTTTEFSNHVFLEYDDKKNYCQEYVHCLKKVPTKYFVYMQEDFILYDSIKHEDIFRYIDVLEKDADVSFVRLIQCGDISKISYKEDMCYITPPHHQHTSMYSFSMQPTIWKKSDFIRMYAEANLQNFDESWNFTHAMNKLKIKGLYVRNEDRKRGKTHYDSFVFPYIATAIVKGKWNISEYPEEITKLFQEFNIDSSVRGER